MDRRRSIHHHIISYLFPSSSSILCFCISFLVLLFTTTTNALVKLPENTTVPAIIVFGDSIVDAGNNDDLITEARCDYPPYGIDFDGGVPTGRFSNGKVPTDILGLFTSCFIFSSLTNLLKCSITLTTHYLSTYQMH